MIIEHPDLNDGLDGVKGKFGVVNTYKDEIADLEHQTKMHKVQLGMERSVTEQLDAKLIELRKDINIIKTRNYYMNGLNG